VAASPRPPARDTQAAAFAALAARAQACTRCPRMAGRTRVLGPGNGALDARVLFVAEAPGRFGGDRTAIPLHGDRSGATFAHLLAVAGLERAAVFVTNAVLCNPRDAAGRNARPTPAELRNCADLLAAQIAVLDPPWVVALGHTALHALAKVAPHRLRRPADLGEPAPWHGRRLVALYHPGPRALIRRPLAAQEADYRRLAARVACTEYRVPSRSAHSALGTRHSALGTLTT
jgi:uracil-DNA glycosylase